MKRTFWFLVLALGVVITACGGTSPTDDSANNNGGDEEVTVTVATVAGTATAAAYRVGDGGWQEASDPANFSFVVDSGGSYDAAVLCDNKDLFIFSLTTDDLSSLKVDCGASASSISFDVNYDVSAVTGASTVLLFHKGSRDSGEEKAVGSNPTGTINVAYGVAGKQDLVLLALDNSNPPQILAAGMRTVDAANNDRYSIPALNNGDSINTASFPDFAAELPGGYSPAWAVYALTPNGTLAMEGLGEDTGGAGHNYYALSFADRELFIVGGEAPGHEVYSFFSSSHGAPAITLPDPIDPTVDGSPIKISGLSLTPDLLVYDIGLFWGPTFTPNVFVSKNYLGDNTSYTMPDLTALTGFANTQPTSGDNVTITISSIQSNLSPAEFADLGDEFFYALSDGKYLKYSIRKLEYQVP